MVVDIVKVLVQNFDVLAMPVVTIVYPLYASIRALETMSNIANDRQWLTYWILYSMITTFEHTFSKVIEFIPIWSYAKLITYFWLVCPRFSGSAYLYQKYVRRFYLNHVAEIPVLEGRSNVTSKKPEPVVHRKKLQEHIRNPREKKYIGKKQEEHMRNAGE